MAERQATCAACGASLDGSSQFCGECGTRIARPQPAVANGDREDKPLNDAATAQEDAATAEPAAPKQPNLARTMLGVNAAQLFGGKAPAAQPAATAARGTPNGLFSNAQTPAGVRPTRPLRPVDTSEPSAHEPTPAVPDSAVTPAGGAETTAEASRDEETSSPNARPHAAAEAPAAPAAPPAASAAKPPPVGTATVMGGTLGPAASEPPKPGVAPGARTVPSNPPMLFASLAPPAAAGGSAPPKTTASTQPPKSEPAPGPESMAGTEAEAVAAERPRRAPSKTMLGISPEAALGLQRMAAEQAAMSSRPPAAGAPPAASAPPTPDAPPAKTPNPMARTMLGMANPLPGPQPMAAGGGLPGMNKNTIQGVALPNAAPPPEPGVRPAADRGAMARTMLGMAPLGSSAPPPPGAPGGAPNAAGFGGRTMLGVPPGAQGTPSNEPPSAPSIPAEVVSARPAMRSDPVGRETARVGTAAPRREIRALWPLVAATLVVVVATLVLLLRAPQESQVDVSAKIISSETGEALLFEVPSAPDGSKIRFGGQEKPLQAGRVSFALAADSLRVGDNLVLAEVVRPEGEPSPVRITLAVYYRIWVDTAALRAEKSALDVIVTALPGTSVTLDGEDLKLDQAGRGTLSYPIDVVSEAKSGVIEHVVRYRVQPPSGETVVDELRTRIPVAMMQIDRPGREVLTDRDSIEIAGAVGKDTQVHLDKTPIPVKDGRFLHRLSLPQPGDYKPRIVATSAGKAPLGVTLAIKRVKDLNQAAAQFAPVADLTYAKLAPNPAIYKGQKISLEGRVYAVDPRGADSVIQMFVRPCPSSRRCPLWVSDPHASEVSVDAWIRVLGIVQGEQQFRSEKNEIVTVPKVEAQFVLPSSP